MVAQAPSRTAHAAAEAFVNLIDISRKESAALGGKVRALARPL
jgi:hypothetical protein